MKWRIYYGDGSTYSSDSDPFFAPSNNVQVIAEEITKNPGFRLRSSRDSYYWMQDRWFACDTAGMWDYLLEHKGPKAIIFGRTLRDDDYWKIYHRAKKEGLGG